MSTVVEQQNEKFADILLDEGEVKIPLKEFSDFAYIFITNQHGEFHYDLIIDGKEQECGGICSLGDELDAVNHAVILGDMNRNLYLNPIIHDIVAKMLEIESIENLLEGDMWIGIEDDRYSKGLFCQIEAKELINGEFSKDEFCVFGYKNTIDENGDLSSDYSNTVINFEISKSKFYDILNYIFAEKASENKRDEVIELIKKNPFLLNNDESVLQKYILRSDFDMVDFLIENGSDIKINNNNSLMLAIEHNLLDMVEFLIEKGADINADSGKALYIASIHKYNEIISLLIEKDIAFSIDAARSLNEKLAEKDLPPMKNLDCSLDSIAGKNIEVAGNYIKNNLSTSSLNKNLY